ncbi:MAG: porin family protein [Desulfobulbaceae bacterium]|nr:porin family protein [Desulfobulbaceae bacterium]
MRKITSVQAIAALGFGILFSASTASAGTVGNPGATTPGGTFAIGLDGQINKRDITGEEKVVPITRKLEYNGELLYADTIKVPGGVTAGEIEYNRYLAVVRYGITDSIEINVNIGMGELKLANVDYDDGIAYGAGVSVTVFQNGNFSLGLNGHMISQNNERTISEKIPFGSSENNLDATMLEYNVALGGSYRVNDVFVPYVGAMYSATDLDFDDEYSLVASAYGFRETHYGKGEYSTEQADEVGGFIGADINFTPNMQLNLEARLGHETSGSLAFDFIF